MNTPNKLTLTRVLLVPLFVALFYWYIPFHYLLATIIFLTAAVTDAIDGYLARKNHLITDFGKFLDPLADKVLVISALSCFLQQQRMHIAPFLLIVGREFMVSALRLVVANKGTVVPASFAGKAKTAFTMAAIVAALLWQTILFDFQLFGIQNTLRPERIIGIILTVMFWIAAALTVWSGWEYLKAYWKDINPNQ